MNALRRVETPQEIIARGIARGWIKPPPPPPPRATPEERKRIRRRTIRESTRRWREKTAGNAGAIMRAWHIGRAALEKLMREGLPHQIMPDGKPRFDAATVGRWIAERTLRRMRGQTPPAWRAHQ